MEPDPAGARVAECWGYNKYGQLGDGMVGTDSDQPALVQGGHQLGHIAAGFGHTCALTDAGAAYCRGRNDAGQLGDASAGVNRSIPVPVANP